MSITIRDVAKLAEVSPSTVSAVLNDRGYISRETRRRVLRAIRRLDYTPRRSARTLATKSSGNVGFIVSESHFSRAESFYTKVFLGSEIEARRHDFYVLLTSVPRQTTGPIKMPRFLKENNIDGIMIAGRVPPKMIREILSKQIPTVIIDYGEQWEHCIRVLIDNKKGVELAVQHLVKLGHERIGFVASEADHPSVQERLQGFHYALREQKISVNERWIILGKDEMSSEMGKEACLTLCRLKKRPTALICGNDSIAIGVIQTARERGFRIPGDLSVVGFDDISSCALMDPPLTTVRVMKEDLGAVAMQALAGLIAGRAQPSRVIREDVELVVRDSTSFPTSIRTW